MPPRKRVRKSSPPAPSSEPSGRKLDNQSQPHVDDDKDAKDEQSLASSSQKTENIFDGAESIDTAIIDEEEGFDDVIGDESEAKGGPSAGPSGRQIYNYGAGGYNALKSFHGQVYSGMAIGGSHTWNYDQGVWKETKVEPDLWKIDYQTTKRRARRAPVGSGAPIGTEYHWLIVAHQVRKKMCPSGPR
jgi:hypothetical protein